MSPALLALVVFAWFGLLLLVAWRTSRGADNDSFFIGNRRSNWVLVAFGMVGTSLSGVTFISVPGSVGASGFTYLQIILGHVIGYLVVAFLLLPLYYRQQVASIYHFLSERLGPRSYKTGAAFFILSRTLGATARLYLVVRILQDVILDSLGVPFWLTAAVILLMIVLYTYEGGVKTIVWTDTLQTAGMLFGLVVCVVFLLSRLDLSLTASVERLQGAGLSTVFGTDPMSRTYWVKQVLAGVFITIAMTGLDQEMMQKNISVTTRRDAQKNVIVLAFTLLAVVTLFLFLGGLLHLFAAQAGMPEKGDRLFPAVGTDRLHRGPHLGAVSKCRWRADGPDLEFLHRLAGPAASHRLGRSAAPAHPPARTPGLCCAVHGDGAGLSRRGRPEHDRPDPEDRRLHLWPVARAVRLRHFHPPRGARRLGACGGAGGAAAVRASRPESARTVRPLRDGAGVAAAQRCAHVRGPVGGVACRSGALNGAARRRSRARGRG
jgi:hypothetical protein